MKLMDLELGEPAVIKDMSQINKWLQQRLIQMGIRNNSKIYVKNRLPFGGPCMLDCEGQCLSIRNKDARYLEVERLSCK
ncbi:FeoA family protein [Halobacillus sp. MO56]